MRSTSPQSIAIDDIVTDTARAVDEGVSTDRERTCTGTMPIIVPCPEGVEPEAWRVAAVFLVGVGCGGVALESELSLLVEHLEEFPVAGRAQELEATLFLYARGYVLSPEDFWSDC